MERISEMIKAVREEISVEQVKARVALVPSHLTFG